MFVEHVQLESQLISQIQKYRSPLLDFVFRLLGMLGTHTMYLTFAPILFWMKKSTASTTNDDYDVNGFHVFARGLVFFICAGVYLTGFIKDLFQLPRPYSPPVKYIEEHPNTTKEYGFPSTHTTHAFSISFYSIYFYTHHIHRTSPDIQLKLYLACSIFTLLIGFSRIYTGMHSFLDVFGGLLIGMGLVFSYQRFLSRFIENLIINPSASVPVTLVITSIMMIQLYPDPKECPCIEDSVASVGAFFGVLLGGWAYHNINLPKFWNLENNLLLKVVIGSVLLVLWRSLAKHIFSLIFRIDVGRLTAIYQRKYLVYIGIGIIASFVIPNIF